MANLKLKETLNKLRNLKEGIDFTDRSQEYHIGFLDGIGAAMEYLEEENDKA